MTCRRIRRLAGLSRARLAARAGVSDTCARVYEADRLAVAPEQRARLDWVFRELREQLAHDMAELVGPLDAAGGMHLR